MAQEPPKKKRKLSRMDDKSKVDSSKESIDLDTKRKQVLKSIISNKLPKETLKYLLTTIIDNDKDGLLSKTLLNTIKTLNSNENKVHCVLCHEEYNPNTTNDNSCIVEFENDDMYEIGRGECSCGGWDCIEGQRCLNCGETSCGGFWNHICYKGYHASTYEEAANICDLEIQPCDECPSEDCDNDTNDQDKDKDKDQDES